MLHLKVGDIMSKPVVTARPGETVQAAARRMNLHRIGCVVVVDRRRVVGVLTERDLLRMIAKGLDPEETTVEEIMTAPAICASRSDEIADAIRVLVLRNVKKLPILEGERLVGIVTFSDFAQLAPTYSDFFSKALSEADRRARERFEKYLHGPPPPWSFV